MGNDVKNAGQSPEGQNPALNKEKTFGIRLRASRWNTIAAAAVLVLAGFLFGWELVLHLQAEEPEMTNAAFAGYGVGFWMLSLATSLACLVECAGRPAGCCFCCCPWGPLWRWTLSTPPGF